MSLDFFSKSHVGESSHSETLRAWRLNTVRVFRYRNFGERRIKVTNVGLQIKHGCLYQEGDPADIFADNPLSCAFADSHLSCVLAQDSCLQEGQQG